MHQIGRVFVPLVFGVLAASANAATFTSEIAFSSPLDSDAYNVSATSGDPVSRSASDPRYSGLSGSAAADLGVLKASASLPTYTGPQGGVLVQMTSAATASYLDTLTFTRAGGGMIDVRFSFAFDGQVSNAVAKPQGGMALSMAVLGPTGTVVGTTPRFSYYLDGALDPSQGGAYGQACSAVVTGTLCRELSSFTFSGNGDKAGTANFSFSVLSGQAFSVVTLMSVNALNGPQLPSAAYFDFAHTTTLTGITTSPGTTITSGTVGSLVSTAGGMTYAPAAPVPEPMSVGLMLAGLALVGVVARRRV